MGWWYETDVSALPLRFQIPKGYCEYGIGQYGQLNIKITDESFMEWFKELEKKIVVTEEPIDSRVKDDGSLSVKYVEGFTQVFDTSNVLMLDGFSFSDSEVDCLVDIDKVYSLNGRSGLTCKLFQVRITPNDHCLFS